MASTFNKGLEILFLIFISLIKYYYFNYTKDRLISGKRIANGEAANYTKIQ